MTRKGFFASVVGALFGAKAVPAKVVPSFKPGDRLAINFPKPAYFSVSGTRYLEKDLYTGILDPRHGDTIAVNGYVPNKLAVSR